MSLAASQATVLHLFERIGKISRDAGIGRPDGHRPRPQPCKASLLACAASSLRLGDQA
jgi:hypothetical protein